MGAGLLAATLLSVDFLWLAFSRMAMLDIFLAGPLVAALSLAFDWRERRSGWALAGSGLCLGVATAAKWSAAWAFPVVLLLVWFCRPGGPGHRALCRTGRVVRCGGRGVSRRMDRLRVAVWARSVSTRAETPADDQLLGGRWREARKPRRQPAGSRPLAAE